jgi:hypothetical protein
MIHHLQRHLLSKYFFSKHLYASEMLKKLFERINNINRIHIFFLISFIHYIL